MIGDAISSSSSLGRLRMPIAVRREDVAIENVNSLRKVK